MTGTVPTTRAWQMPWRITPPAVFPPVLGLLGLALVWRRAAEVLGTPPAIATALFLAASAFFVVLLVCYIARLMNAPETLEAELGTVPGRGGIAAGSLCLLAVAAGLVPLWADGARLMLVAGLTVHALQAGLTVRALCRVEDIRAHTTPTWHVSFVGFIVAPLAAVPLGWTGLSQAILFAALPVAAAILCLCCFRLLRDGVAPALRPLQAIHVAPLALIGTAAYLLGRTGLAVAAACGAILVLSLLLARVRWLIAAGPTPLWGSFTFPLAAFTGLMLALVPVWDGFRWIGAVALCCASLVVPWIAWRVLRLWPSGALARRGVAAPN